MTCGIEYVPNRNVLMEVEGFNQRVRTVELADLNLLRRTVVVPVIVVGTTVEVSVLDVIM